MTARELFIVVLIIATVTLMTRALPFLVFRGERRVPRVITYLGETLPPATFGMLVVLCFFSGVDPTELPYGIPELCATALALALQLFFKRTLLSIISATLLYVLLVSFVF